MLGRALKKFPDISSEKFFHWCIGFGFFITYLFFLESPRYFLSHRWFNLSSNDGVFFLNLLIWAATTISFLFIGLGKQIRWAAAIAMIGHYLLRNSSLFAFWGWSKFIYFALFLLILFPSKKDSRGFEYLKRYLPPPVQLMESFLTVSYLATLMSRFGNPYWHKGTILMETLSSRVFSRFAFIDWSAFDSPLRFFSYAALFFEALGAVFLFLPAKLKKWTIFGLISMHGGLHIAGFLGPWQILLIGCLVYVWPQSPAPPLKKYPLFLALFALTVTAALPRRLVPESFYPIVKVSRSVTEYVGTYNLAASNMMHTAPAFAVATSVWTMIEGKVDKIYQSDLNQNVKGDYHSLVDGVHQGLFRGFLNSIPRKFETEIDVEEEVAEVEQRKKQVYLEMVGNAFCLAGERNGKSPEQIALAMYLLNRPTPGKNFIKMVDSAVIQCRDQGFKREIPQDSKFFPAFVDSYNEIKKIEALMAKDNQ